MTHHVCIVCVRGTHRLAFSVHVMRDRMAAVVVMLNFGAVHSVLWAFGFLFWQVFSFRRGIKFPQVLFAKLLGVGMCPPLLS